MLERLLQGDSFVSGLTEEQLRALDSLGRQASFEENELILLAGERSRSFYLLLSGSASVEVATDFCTICIQALAPGDAFGWSSLLDDHDTLFQVRARENCSVLCLEGVALTALCEENPALGVKLLQRVLHTVARRVHGLESRLAEFCGLSPGAR
jgi:CRP-like cAMP-binding protein